ncbi:MAG: TerC/Alx family metal homeostasis membrane protein [Saprospiraceae bacterium]|nr:TerC/Alx family metal homeostasis membrane protein [Saprospiraceae bacterium]
MMIWLIFGVILVGLLAIDLGILNKGTQTLTPREATRNSIIWVSIGLLFSVFVYFSYTHHWFGIGLDIGHQVSGGVAMTQYISGYLVELSLSIDNLFVFALIFRYFKVPAQSQYRVLFWGIIIALVLRGLMIFGGVLLIQRFHWIEYFFAAIIIYSAYRMWASGDDGLNIEEMPMVIWLRKWMRMVHYYKEDHFFTHEGGKWHATPLFLTFLVVNIVDVIFAFDSIPAIFAITHDEFLIFTSNIFAILGLRSLYFLLVGMLDKFVHLKTSLIVILLFIGIKMLASNFIHLPSGLALIIILVILGAGILTSVYSKKKSTDQGT